MKSMSKLNGRHRDGNNEVARGRTKIIILQSWDLERERTTLGESSLVALACYYPARITMLLNITWT